MAHPVPAFLQQSTTATMCGHLENHIQPPPPIPPFLLAWNLSPKHIEPKDIIMLKPNVNKNVLIIASVQVVQKLI